jgi:hypothetical protein
MPFFAITMVIVVIRGGGGGGGEPEGGAADAMVPSSPSLWQAGLNLRAIYLRTLDTMV